MVRLRRRPATRRVCPGRRAWSDSRPHPLPSRQTGPLSRDAAKQPSRRASLSLQVASSPAPSVPCPSILPHMPSLGAAADSSQALADTDAGPGRPPGLRQDGPELRGSSFRTHDSSPSWGLLATLGGIRRPRRFRGWRRAGARSRSRAAGSPRSARRRRGAIPSRRTR